MPYPGCPFADTFQSGVITALDTEKSSTLISKEDIQRNLSWLCSSPKISTYRVNTLKSNPVEVSEAINKHACLILGEENNLNMEVHPLVSNIIIVHHDDISEEALEKRPKEVIVDVDCGAAILRGAHVYAPGIMAMMTGTQINDDVSIYADASRKCKKGLQKLYGCPNKIFVGNGVVKMVRHQLYGEKLNPRGVAVEVTKTISGCPPLGDNFLPPGWALLQNLPSILCVRALDPRPSEKIIDMCASPGNKTTHIAELMQNEGILIAIDKTETKVSRLKQRCEEFGAKAHIFEEDSSKIVCPDHNFKKCIEDGPPFLPETFDRILLDAPCSALGKRPQLVNRVSEKVIRSYIPLQRRLFESAVKLLKVDGRLVYSTCTITLAENEGIVAWALRTFKCLELIRSDLCLGGPGWRGSSLTDEERGLVQRFGPDQEVDSVGFFFASFVKKCSFYADRNN